jgi:pilus assembly protein FimV
VRFAVELSGDGSGIVKLSSTRRLNEPFLDFLVEAKWPTGRVLRSYTALVDLPVYAEVSSEVVNLGSAPTAAVTQPTNDKPAPVVVEESSTGDVESADVTVADSMPERVIPQTVEATPVATRATVTNSPSAVKPASSRDNASSAASYMTQRNDTLWEIAKSVRPSSSMSVQQVMLALQKYNESAFIGGNINRLKAGVELQIPSVDVMREVSARAAIGEVKQQNQRWQNAQLDATERRTQSNRNSASEEGHLSLSSSGTGVANGRDDADADTAGMRSQLSQARNDLAAARSSSDELSEEVGTLNTQVEQLERLLELKSAELAQLQQQMGQEPAASAGSAEIKALEESLASDKAAAADVAESDAEATEDEEQVVEKIAEEPVEAEVAGSFMDDVLAQPMYLGGVALFILAVVALLLLRRKRQSEEQAFSDFENFEFDDDSTADSSASLDDAESELAQADEPEDTVAEEFVDTELDLDVDDEIEPGKTTAQTGDAIGEADIYIAYGRFEQAAELLSGAIAAAPSDIALRAKLLEVYVESKNKDGFQKQFVALQGLGAEAEVNAAKELLTAHDGVADWLDGLSAATAADDSSYALDDETFDHIDLDLPADDDDILDDTDVTMVRDGISLAGFDGVDDLAVDTDAELEELQLDVELDELQLDEELDGELLEELDDVAVETDELALDLDDLDLSELEDDSESLVLDAEAEVEVDELSLDDDDLSMDLSSIDFDDDAAPALSLDDVEDLTDLELDGLDLGLDESVAVEIDDEADELELSLGDELDLSALEDLDDAPAANADDELQLDVDLDLDLDLESDALEVVDAVESEEVVDAVESEVVEMDDAQLSHAFDAESLDAELDDEDATVALAEFEGEDFEFLSDADEISTKLDLAKAYVEMGDVDGARDILAEVVAEGNESQKAEADKMLANLS